MEKLSSENRIPADRQTWESGIARYWFEDDILVSDSKSVLRTPELIRENAALVKEISGNKPVKLLIYLAKSPVPDKETRRVSAEILPQIYSAMAMVSEPGLSALIIKMVFALRKPPIPMKSFTDDKQALKWLKEIAN